MHKINSFGLDKIAEIKLSFNLFFFCQRLYAVQCTYLNDDTFIVFVTELILFLYRYSNSDCYILTTLPAVSSVAKRTLSVREVWGSIPGPVKSANDSPPLRRFFGAVLPRR